MSRRGSDDEPLASLDVLSPDGRHFATVALDRPRVTVGRLPPPSAEARPDVALPDTESFVSRVHCVLERDGGVWYLVDNGSRNGTFLARAGDTERVTARTALADGDTVRIVGVVAAGGETQHWELRFSDPYGTREAPVPPLPSAACLDYDTAEGRLFLRAGTDAWPVPLSPHEHRLVRFMVERNGAHGGAAVLCSHAELISAVWQDEPLHDQADLNRLVWGLRQKLEPDGGEPLIENARALGYRLRTCPRG